MSDKPFIAVRVEERVNRLTEAALRLFRWRETVIPYRGYGTEQQIRVMGRVVLGPPRAPGILPEAVQELLNRRGWRNFFVSPCVSAPFRVRVGDKVISGRCDRGGYIDIRIPDHGLPPGTQQVQIETRESADNTLEVDVISDDVTFGIVSDIDDTILTTFLPRPMIAAWNAFVVTEQARTAVAGMAEMYRTLLEDHPGTPIVYVSTGSFDTVPFLTRFLKTKGYPFGPLLMTDWGPTNTGWFRSGMEHKQRSLRQLARDFPRISWLLIGDDGQHDPSIYAEFAAEFPDRVRAIAIRQLTPAEHVLAHGTTAELPEETERSARREVRAGDGYGLLPLVREQLAKARAAQPATQPSAEPAPHEVPSYEPRAEEPGEPS